MHPLFRATLSVLTTTISASALDLSGTVTNPDGTPRASVTVALASSGASATTDGSGKWILSSTTGIEGRALQRKEASHLTLEDGRLRLTFDGRDLSGHVSGITSLRQAAPAFAARAASAVPDTIVYSLGGKVFLRDTASVSRTGIVETFDTTWNAAIIYGWLSDARDGQRYRTVKIGTQTWMAENLNVKVDSSWCYENSADSCAKYGRLYQWSAAMGLDASYNNKEWGGALPRQGVCPSGWHIPNVAEWDTLEVAVGGRDTAGSKLKSTNGWYDSSNSKDDYGFRALPAGHRYDDGSFDCVDNHATFRSSTENDAKNAWNPRLYAGDNVLYLGYTYKTYGFSVRCLKD